MFVFGSKISANVCVCGTIINENKTNLDAADVALLTDNNHTISIWL